MLRAEMVPPLPLRDMAPGRRAAIARRDRVLRMLRDVFVFLGMAVYAGALMPSLRNLRGAPHLQVGETDPFGTFAQVAILVVVGVYTLCNWRKVRATLRPMAPFLAILALCAVSAFWSDYPFASVRRTVSFMTGFGFGLFCYLELGLTGTIAAFGRCVTWLLGLSLAAWLLVPEVGSETLSGYEGTLRGLFSTKNETGTTIELATGYYLYLIVRDRRFGWPVLGLVMAATCLVLARSSTAATICTALVGAGAFAFFWRSRLIVLLLFVAVSLVGALATLTVLDPALPFTLLGRDSSFTGRAPLWQASLEAIAQRPWFGYGYSGFWNADSRVVQQIWRQVGWNAPSAHNGYMDTALQIGLVGLAMFLLAWGRIIYGALAVAWRGGMPEAVWILLLMLDDVILNFSEGTMSYPDPFTVMMPAVIIGLYTVQRAHRVRVAAERRQRRAAPWQALSGAAAAGMAGRTRGGAAS